jgi:hypothetical protein
MSKNKHLYDYKWGLGIEHEMHIFHTPQIQKGKNITDCILFDSSTVIDKILDDKNNGINLSYSDYSFLKTVPFETSGRRCNNKWVIKSVPIKMPEFITDEPFCSLNDKRTLGNMVKEIAIYKERFYNILMLDKNTQRLVNRYGKLCEHPFGMTRSLKYPIDDRYGTYVFDKTKAGNDLLVPEYNGSYHITFTLPYKEDTPRNDFIKMHQNFCNQLQWLEPLLLTQYFTGDEYSPGTLQERVRGSFRVMIIGWGNLAGTDLRLLGKGIGRYAKTPSYWRNGLTFKDVDKLQPCYEPSPMALKEGATTSLSSNFRTFGSTDPLRPMHRESGIGMTKPNGVEFRIFDHFADIHIEHLVKLISLVAENSRVTQTNGYVYENKDWIETVHNIMKNGYKSHLSNKYINLLRKKLDLKINTTSIIANDVFKQIYRELWKKNINGDWSKIFNGLEQETKLTSETKYNNLIFPDINKKAWQFAFMLKLNKEATLLRNFNLLSQYLNYVKTITYEDFELIVLEIFGQKWKYDIEDIAYFYESLKIILIKNNNGTINNLIIQNDIDVYNDFNTKIQDYFTQNYISNIL